MSSKARKLLERMRRSKSGWKRRDLDKLYRDYGFVMTRVRNHDIVKHPMFLQLRVTLPRHTDIAIAYVQEAVKKVDQLIKLTEAANEQ